MVSLRQVSVATKIKSSMVMAALVVAQTMPLNVMAFNLSSNANTSSLSAPVYSKLDSSSLGVSDTKEPAPDLSPINFDGKDNKASAALSDDAAVEPVTATPSARLDSDDAGTLNATVQKENFVPKPPLESTSNVVGEESVVPAKDKKKQAKADAYEKSLRATADVVGPIDLQPTDDEIRDKVVTIQKAEKGELAEIWNAALCRSQDIQFVVQKLMPTKDPKHSTAMMMKMLSTAMYGAVAAGGMMGGSMGTGAGMAQSAGASLIMSAFGQIGAKSQKKVMVTETEAIMLYKMIRDVGRDVSHDFHEYKKNIGQVGRAFTDYEDLQKMVADARAGQDAAAQVQMEYTLRKQRRDIDGLNEDARRSRDSLITLAGAEAVDNLDRQIASESEKIGQPLVDQEDIPKEEKSEGKSISKTDSVDENATSVRKKKIATAPKREDKSVAEATVELDDAGSDEDAVDKTDADKSSEKHL